ncbi:hypothetical protein C3Y94_025855 [Rhizobium ruizarguesonis]|uniref:hypothetical protein n=1 Tax=Rhizobium ruizarguesonis TaxID=2081791 RepID=UPI00163A2D25|nr:hypothetical protein [Rhizobium ruizarguesonis]MBC2806579.1 hypothetical protein [Rhizobium ruizarguesonis]
MSFVIAWPGGGYVYKTDGMNLKVRDPRDATPFYTREAAQAAKPGHHRDMGGRGYVGTIFNRDTAISWFEHSQQFLSRYR